LTVKSLEYQEKVEEYGVYWNFFFTMAVIKVFSEMFLRKSNVALESLRAKLWRSPTFLVPVLLPIFYEILLNLEFDFEYFIGPGEKSTKMTLKHAIMDLPHQTEQKINFLANFFLQNREGIFSSLGYFSIYCYGNLLSNLYFRGQKSDTRETGPNLKYKFLNLSLFMTFLVLPISVKFIDSGSRRLGNLTFVVWMYGINAMFLYLSLLVTTSFKVKKLYQFPKLLYFFGKFQFSAFLVANILTGLVNMTMDTGSMGRLESMFIMVIYLGVVSGYVCWRGSGE